MPNAVVIVIDRLSASYLGPYGNTWLDTPEFNRLATESLICDFALSDTPDLQRVYRSYWRGLHALSTDWGDTPNIVEALNRAGVYTQLLTDDPRVGNDDLASAFSERVILDVPEGAATCTEIVQTQLAQLFAAAIEALETLTPPFFLWIHARGMDGPWDAPYEMRRQYAEEGDPDPPALVEPPRLILEPDFDPDDLLGLVRAYAGQVAVLDACCGAFGDALKRVESHPSTLLVWTSPRGYPVGEHRRVGNMPGPLYGELLQVPCFIRVPDHLVSQRSHAFIQPADLAPTLLNWWNIPTPTMRSAHNLLQLVRNPDTLVRPASVADQGDNLAIRTSAWFASFVGNTQAELYVKPDDRFETNEISSRCQDVVQQFDTWALAFRDAAATGFASFPLLPKALSEKRG